MKKEFVIAWINHQLKKYGKTTVVAQSDDWDEVTAKMYWKSKHPGRDWEIVTSWEK